MPHVALFCMSSSFRDEGASTVVAGWKSAAGLSGEVP